MLQLKATAMKQPLSVNNSLIYLLRCKLLAFIIKRNASNITQYLQFKTSVVATQILKRTGYKLSKQFKFRNSQLSSFHEVTATGWTIGVRFPTGAGNFFLRHRVHTGSGAHPAYYPMGNRGSISI